MTMLIRSGVLMLAHQRLRDLAGMLGVKKDLTHVVAEVSEALAPVRHRSVEEQIRARAEAAIRMLESGTPIELPATARLGFRLSRYAILGTQLLELPWIAETFAPGRAWATDVLRRGTPDPNLSLVAVGAARFALTAGRRALDASSGNDTDRAEIRAATLGMLASIASDVIVDPVLRGALLAGSKSEWNRTLPRSAIAAVEQRIVKNLMQSPPASKWYHFWPDYDAVPRSLFNGMAETFNVQFAGARELGFADFPDGFTPRGIGGDELEGAYRMFRLGGTIGREWPWVKWWGVLIPIFLTPAIAASLIWISPDVRAYFGSTAEYRPSHGFNDRPHADSLAIGLATGSIVPFIYVLLMKSTIPGSPEPFVTNWAFFFGRLGLFSFYLLAAGLNSDPWVRWLLIALLISADFYALFRGMFTRNQGEFLVWLIQILPFISSVLALTFAWIVKAARIEVESDPGWLILALGIFFFVASGIAALVAIPLAHSGITTFTDADPRRFIGSLPTGDGARTRALAGVFGDDALWRTASGVAELTQLRYPSGPRIIAKLWWTGSGTLQVRHSGRKITFIRPSTADLEVAVPPFSTGEQLAVRLRAALPGLTVNAVSGDRPLPALAMFEDTGSTPRDVGTTEQLAYALHHATRAAATTLFGESGPSCNALEGFEIVPSAAMGDAPGTAMGLAADLAAILALGAAPALEGDLGEAERVLRLWNLDERRSNEWRSLVTGNAAPEAPAPSEPERLLDRMGWINTFRAWTRVATNPHEDTDADTAAHFTPPLLDDGARPSPPTNRQLSDAMRFLFGLGA